jgi:stalled ribosome alternative rescue factor ArfA
VFSSQLLDLQKRIWKTRKGKGPYLRERIDEEEQDAAA